MVVSQLIHEMNNIKQTQSQYGMPEIGDLFSTRPCDVRDTINSVYFMLRQRIQDIDSRNEFRQKQNRADQAAADAETQAARAKAKVEGLSREIDDLKNRIKNADSKHKTEQAKVTSERDELIKSLTRIEHKEAQYRHEIKNLGQQVSKLQDQIKAKLFDKRAANNKENDGGAANTGMSTTGKIVASNEVVFSKMSSENDMHLMISKS